VLWLTWTPRSLRDFAYFSGSHPRNRVAWLRLSLRAVLHLFKAYVDSEILAAILALEFLNVSALVVPYSDLEGI